MTSFRLRQWGSSDWTHITISSDDEEMEEQIIERTRDMLLLTDLHVQELDEDGKWGDV